MSYKTISLGCLDVSFVPVRWTRSTATWIGIVLGKGHICSLRKRLSSVPVKGRGGVCSCSSSLNVFPRDLNRFGPIRPPQMSRKNMKPEIVFKFNKFWTMILLELDA